jgi:hypothetical protein
MPLSKEMVHFVVEEYVAYKRYLNLPDKIPQAEPFNMVRLMYDERYNLKYTLVIASYMVAGWSLYEYGVRVTSFSEELLEALCTVEAL